MPVISGPATVGEGATTSNYTVTLVNAAGAPVTVSSATNVTVVFANGSAEAGDYVANAADADDPERRVVRDLHGRDQRGCRFYGRAFVASISSVQDTGEFEAINTTTGTAGLLPAVTTTISDNDVPPTISIDNVTVNEDAGTMTFTVSLSHATTAPVSFSYATSNGSDPGDASAADYTATSGSARSPQPHHRHLHGGDQR